MVTLFGLFVGPMLIPMLAGLLSRRISWRGAAAGSVAGFAAGFGFFLYKNLVLSGRPAIDPNWVRYDFEAISILASFGATLIVMLLVTVLERSSPEERDRTAAFFARLQRPIDLSNADAPARIENFSPFHIMAWITIAAGVMLWGAAAVRPSGLGGAINFGAGLVLVLIGNGFRRLHKRFVRNGRGSSDAPTVLAGRPQGPE